MKIKYNYIALLLLTFLIPLILFIIAIKKTPYMIFSYEEQKNMINMIYITMSILILNFVIKCKIYNE